MKYYRLSEEELLELIRGDLYSYALERGGVDNWEWEVNARLDFIDMCNKEDGTNYESIEEIAEDEIARYELIGEE